MDARSKRRRAYFRGHASEFAAAGVLLTRGYLVLERRYKCPFGEIDLVARRGRRIAFVEVKQRPSRALCEEAMTNASRARLRGAATYWLARHAHYRDFEQGFDAVFVVPWRWPAYVPDVG